MKNSILIFLILLLFKSLASANELDISAKNISIDKKSREQFELRTHIRMMDIIEPTPQTVDALMKLDLASGVNVDIKIKK